MVSSMSASCTCMTAFKDMCLPLGMEALENHGIMHSRCKTTLHGLTVTKAMFLYIAHHFAPTMRPTKTDLKAVFMKITTMKVGS